MKLSKSLEELDAVADELLAKSKAAADSKDDEELAPEDVSSDAEETDSKDETEEEEDEDVKKSCNCPDDKLTKSDDEGSEDDDIEKCDANGDVADVKKSEDAEDEDGGDETPDEGDIEKSLQDDFEANDLIKSGVENSEFMAAVVEVLTKSLSDVQYDLQHQKRVNEASDNIIAKSMQAVLQANATLQATNERLTRRINKIEKSMSQGFDRVMDSLDEIASQPAGMRKSLASIDVHDRDFGSSLNGQPVSAGFESLSKSQVLSTLQNEFMSGNTSVTSQDIIGYESGAPLRIDLQTLVANKCK